MKSGYIMKTTVSFRLIASLSCYFLFEIITLSQDGRPGIECGCNDYGRYVEPSSKVILVEDGGSVQEGRSGKGKYTVEVTPAPLDNRHIYIYYNGVSIFDEVTSATEWGFSPDEDRFVMHGQSNGSHWCRMIDLSPASTNGTTPIPHDLISSNSFQPDIRFSPHGKYLLYAAITYQNFLSLYIFDCKTGDQVYYVSVANLVGLASGKSVAGWGFSPDAKDASFVHAYQTDVDKYTFAVVNLSKRPYEYIVGGTNNQLGQESWKFSPCGDKFARVFTGQTGLEGHLYSTNLYNVSESFNPDGYEYIFSDIGGHYAKYINSSTPVRISEDISGEQCADQTKPVWGAGTMIDTGKVEGVKLELQWDGATDAQRSDRL